MFIFASMEAKELRIGNYIEGYQLVKQQLINQKPIEGTKVYNYVLHSVNKHLLFYCEDYSKYRPIPLTEDWLIKFGFTLTPSRYEKGDFNIYMLCINNSPHFDYIIIYKGFETKLIKPNVHTLQNLYFALTGEELELK